MELYSIDNKINSDIIRQENDEFITILSELSKIELNEENIPDVISISMKYYNFEQKFLGPAWLEAQKTNYEKIPEVAASTIYDPILKKINRQEYRTYEVILKKITEWNKYKIDIEEAKKQMDKINGETDFLKYEPVSHTSFVPTYIEYALDIRTPNKESFIDIFNQIKTSLFVPFVYYKSPVSSKKLYKIFNSKFDIPPSWIEQYEEIKDGGVYMKVMSSLEDNFFSKQVKYENLFVDAEILPYTILNDKMLNKEDQITLIINHVINKEVSYKELLERIENSINGFEYSIISTKEKDIKGSFTVNIEEPLNNVKFSLTHAILNDEIMSRYLFADEYVKTSFQKDRLTLKFKQTYPLKDVLFSFTEDTQNSVNVEIKVSRVQTQKQMSDIINIFTRLLSYFFKEKNKEILNLYTSVFSKDSLIYKTKNAKVQKNVSGGKRGDLLYKHDEFMFPKMYSRQCQKQKQPIIVSEEESKTYKSNEVMEFPKGSGVFFACKPREENEKQDYIYPGLQENILSNKQIYPNLPCCFKTDQYTKKSSKLKMYLEGNVNFETNVDTLPPTQLGYIKKSGKDIEVGKFAEAPYYIREVISQCGYDEISPGVSPILKLGVDDMPDSCLHCFERAFNSTNYLLSNFEERSKMVYDVRRKLVETLEKFPSQQLFQTNLDKLKMELRDPFFPIEIDLFFTHLSKIYDCNIFMFIENDEFPNGNMFLPRFAKVYINDDIYNPDKRSVCLIKSITTNKVWNYRYSLLVMYPFFKENGEVYTSQKKIFEQMNSLVVNTYSYQLINIESYK